MIHPFRFVGLCALHHAVTLHSLCTMGNHSRKNSIPSITLA
jgi:hypothetical protein